MDCFVYHGSPTSNLKEIIPQNHRRIYASGDMITAALFAVRRQNAQHGLFARTIGCHTDGVPFICERYKSAFDDLYANASGSIYVLDAQQFDCDKHYFMVTTTAPQKIIREIKIENLKDYLLAAEKNKELRIYRYPNRPSSIPQDDSDFVKVCCKYNSLSVLEEFKELFPDVYLKNKQELDKIQSNN